MANKRMRKFSEKDLVVGELYMIRQLKHVYFNVRYDGHIECSRNHWHKPLIYLKTEKGMRDFESKSHYFLSEGKELIIAYYSIEWLKKARV
jgi:hypothetical protein